MAGDTFDVNENDRIIAELMSDWEEAPEPGSARVGHVEHHGNDDLPTPVVQTKLSSAGYTYIYDRLTGDRSLTNRNMLPTQMQKRRPDSTAVFMRTDPRLDPKFKAPKRNKLKCRLHLDDPDRGTWDEMGFPTCRKENLVSKYHVNRHMASKHRDELAAINDLEYQREDEDRKEFQRMLMQQAVRTGVPISAVGMEQPKRRQKNPNRVAAGKRTAAKLATGAA